MKTLAFIPTEISNCNNLCAFMYGSYILNIFSVVLTVNFSLHSIFPFALIPKVVFIYMCGFSSLQQCWSIPSASSILLINCGGVLMCHVFTITYGILVSVAMSQFAHACAVDVALYLCCLYLMHN